MITIWHLQHLYLVAASVTDETGRVFGRDGYATGVEVRVPGRDPATANRWLAYLKAQGFEDAPRHVLVMWRETLDRSGSAMPRREPVYMTPGKANLPNVAERPTAGIPS